MKDACTNTTTVRMIILSSQHRNRSPQALHSIYNCGNSALECLAKKDGCRTSTTVTMTLSDLPSTKTGVHKHGSTTTVVETEF